MWKCAVCGKENDSLLCPQCGFDGSMDYERYPTLGRVTGPAVSARKETWENPREKYFTCASCGGKQFYLDRTTDKLVCAQCGTPISTEKRCPVCQNILAEDHVFCGKCGTRVDGSEQKNTVPYYYNPPSQRVNDNGGKKPSKGVQPSPGWFQKHTLISKYLGEPVVGIAQATGTLYVYQDRLEYIKTMGSSLGYAFGLVGMAVATNKMKKTESPVDVFFFRDIQNAYVGKYSGLMATLVLQLADGQMFTFAGTFSKQSAVNLVNIILNGKRAGQNL